MGLKHLKQQNPDLNINLIDLISELDPTKTKKLTPLLIKILKEGIERHTTDMYWGPDHKESITSDLIKKLPAAKKTFFNWICNSYYNIDNLDKIPLFVDYLERGLIENPDISKYNGFQDIISEIGIASTKEMLKKSKKDIMVVHDDDEWLFFKPLTHDSAVTYGFGTKWCTSMKNDPEYFYRYSNQGVLIYVINKKTGKKFGVHSNSEIKMAIYDEIDNNIDSFETGLPNELIKKLFGLLDVKTNQKNYELFSPEEKIKSGKHYGLKLSGMEPVEMYELPMEEPMVERPIINIQPRLMPQPRLTPRNFFRNEPEVNTDFEDLP